MAFLDYTGLGSFLTKLKGLFVQSVNGNLPDNTGNVTIQNRTFMFNDSNWSSSATNGFYTLTINYALSGIFGVYKANTNGTFSRATCSIDIGESSATLRSVAKFSGYAILGIVDISRVEVITDANGANIVTTYATKTEVSSNYTPLTTAYFS